MSEPIKAGDLVMIVRPSECCVRAGKTHLMNWHYGKTFRVTSLYMNHGHCHACGDKTPQLNALGSGQRYGYEVNRLLRIDPPAQGETTETHKELQV